MHNSGDLYCLSVAGGVIDSETGKELVRTAMNMILEHTNKKHVEIHNGVLALETQFKETRIGTHAGFKFEAVIEQGSETIRATFIVRPHKDPDWLVENAVWHKIPKVPWFETDGDPKWN